MRQQRNILLVEDNEGDIFLTKEAMAESTIDYKITVLKNGNDVMPYLRNEQQFALAITPDLILLDLNLPRKNGLEVLSELKTCTICRIIPVIMLTTSSSDRDIAAAYGSHVNSYITKPVDGTSYSKVIEAIENFWFLTCTLHKPVL